VRFSRFRSVVRGMLVVAVSQMCMMRGQFVAAGFVVLCCFLMVARRMFVVLGGLMMMFRCLLGHEVPPRRCRARNLRDGTAMRGLWQRLIAEMSFLNNDPMNAGLREGVVVTRAPLDSDCISRCYIGIVAAGRNSLAWWRGDVSNVRFSAVYVQRGFH